ncbi:MAG: helix-turn-helix domain-containing protein [Oceanospirillales bacterium]|nr:helix-turn-helix domain-containing protein [Oceanospirillales bacterium]
MSDTVRVVVVAFNRISAFHLSVPGVVFGEIRSEPTCFELCVCSPEGRRLDTNAGYAIVVDHGLEAVESADIVIVPSWRDPAECAPQELLDALNAAHKRGGTVVGLCLGAYVLAQAGLLDGRQATTHWAYCKDFSRQYPDVQLNPDVLYIDDDRVVTSAGTAAGIDCCLNMLRERQGAEVANQVARRLVVPPHRHGGQAQFIEQPVAVKSHRSGLSDLLDWVRANLHQKHTLDSLAQRVHMSRRTFTRVFQKTTGSSVGQWLLAERLQHSQRLLESSDLPVEQVAERVGFGSAVVMRQHFKKALGVAPNQWRRAFKGET